MKIDRERFLEDGYLVLRNIVPPQLLAELRTSYETLVDRQREVWARERKPDDPPRGNWETSAQPALSLEMVGDALDEKTANAVEFLLHENTLGASAELLGVADPVLIGMLVLCNPVSDRGPSTWHRDIRPIDMAPHEALLNNLLENGPEHLQWNIALYDDDVLWILPGSHRRINTEEENRQLQANSKVPLPGGVQTHLKAGDGVVYISSTLHWGSNYSTKLRRTLHPVYHAHSGYPDSHFARYLKPESQSNFERWRERSKRQCDDTEAALRAVLQRDAEAFCAALERLRPGQGKQNKRLLLVYLGKAAYLIRLHKNPDLEGVHPWWKYALPRPNPGLLNWGPEFAQRFTMEESDALWEIYKGIDAMLQTDEEQYLAGFISEAMRYRYVELPEELTVENFIADWGELAER